MRIFGGGHHVLLVLFTALVLYWHCSYRNWSA